MHDQEATQTGFLLTGGTGMMGQALSGELGRREVRIVQAIRGEPVRKPDVPPGTEQISWQPEAQAPFADPGLLEGIDVAVHLSGANLAARRWTPAYKREIVSSRTVTTAALARTLAALKRPPRLLITASATGIYGNRGDELLTEASAHGHDFLSQTCAAWEASAQPAVDAGIRVVHLRLGVVLDPRGGALAKVLPLFRLGLGGRLGSGQQWMSWIAIDDVIGAILHLAGYGAEPSRPLTIAAAGARNMLLDALEGAVNCVSPDPVTNAEYTRALAAVVHRPAIAAAPAFALRLALGEMADLALLASCRAIPAKLLSSGFEFRYPAIGPALTHLLG